MKLGILGTGMIVQYGALPTIEQLNLEYVSILGVKELEEQTKELTAKYQLDRYHLDYDEMLDTDIDTDTLRYQIACTLNLLKKLC